ncbi:MAG: aldehyde dehydrogenase family protein, partial [Gammaproteobacteria bacterium]|nr:aldehyde dehydrogenase family protein [Gammaproteobacteria bacterium]
MKQPHRRLGIARTNPGVSFAGGWRRGARAPRFTSIEPATGKPLGEVSGATNEDYEELLGASWEAFQQWRDIPAPRRGEAIRAIADALRAHKDPLGTLVARESGKIKAEGDGEVQEMIDIADFAVGLSRQLYGLTMPSERPRHRLYEQWHPLGLVGIVTAFNFPVAVWSWNAFIAAVCGNACIWKPSPKTPLASIAVQRLCNEVLADGGFPQVFSLLNTDDMRLAGRFVDDARIDLLSFTGSCAAGRQVAQRVAGRLGKYLLELGGNNAIVVDEDANLDLAVPAILFGAVGTAGQRCTTTRRLLVHRSRVKELTKRLVAAYRQVRIGDPLQKGTLMGPLIDETAVERYLATIAELRQQGAKILTGGRRVKRAGYFVEPTIVMAENDWPAVQ